MTYWCQQKCKNLIYWSLITESVRGHYTNICFLTNFTELEITKNRANYWWGQMYCGPPNQNFGWPMVHPAHAAAPPPCMKLQIYMMTHKLRTKCRRRNNTTVSVVDKTGQFLCHIGTRISNTCNSADNLMICTKSFTEFRPNYGLGGMVLVGLSRKRATSYVVCT